jgi:hypothetical protein
MINATATATATASTSTTTTSSTPAVVAAVVATNATNIHDDSCDDDDNNNNSDTNRDDYDDDIYIHNNNSNIDDSIIDDSMLLQNMNIDDDYNLLLQMDDNEEEDNNNDTNDGVITSTSTPPPSPSPQVHQPSLPSSFFSFVRRPITTTNQPTTTGQQQQHIHLRRPDDDDDDVDEAVVKTQFIQAIHSEYFSQYYTLTIQDERQINSLRDSIFTTTTTTAVIATNDIDTNDKSDDRTVHSIVNESTTGTTSINTNRIASQTTTKKSFPFWFSITPSRKNSTDLLNQQIQFWNQIVMVPPAVSHGEVVPPQVKNCPPRIGSLWFNTTTTVNQKLPRQQSQPQPQPQPQPDHPSSTRRYSPSVLLWRSSQCSSSGSTLSSSSFSSNATWIQFSPDPTSLSHTDADTSKMLTTPPLKMQCDIVLWTTGMMILLYQPPQSQIDILPPLFSSLSSNNSNRAQQKFKILTTIPWLNLDYIEPYYTYFAEDEKDNAHEKETECDDTTTTSINTTQPPTPAPTSHGTLSFGPIPMAESKVMDVVTAATGMDENDTTVLEIRNIPTMSKKKTRLVYGIRCHYRDALASSSASEQMQQQQCMSIICNTPFHRDAMYSIMTDIIIAYRTYHESEIRITLPDTTTTSTTTPAEQPTQQLPTSPGWQYHYYYKPYFTMAVTSRMEENEEIYNNIYIHMTLDIPSSDPAIVAANTSEAPKNYINQLDDYNGMAPLHYAVYYNQVPAIVRLFELGRGSDGVSYANSNIDANVSDLHHSWTPLDYCIIYELPVSTMDLLRQYGATRTTVCTVDAAKSSRWTNNYRTNHDDTPTKIHWKGELFGKVAVTEQIIEHRRREGVQQQQVQDLVTEQQRTTRQLFQQRGEQIDALSEGATKLQTNAQDFASMAQQLKQRSQRQHARYNRWFPFG